ncbi:hypothetical protein U9Z24_04090 [Escherichia coli]|uniref:hypothetical protein n=1 Tax=Enterobacter roggenkampii TaxID=1812935 RepID=UPI001A0E0284|nr:hypothetical protein [Enterobacter roggenkampii]EGO4099527.1 hypothetical protein [Escherichia coli]EGO4182656.1 hypothetical protein [Escherichia coli]MCE1945968.1 hypothetical protein [Enterobacter roggenkampii]
MIKRYALVKDNVVENLIAWDGEGDLFPGYDAIELSDELIASVGWSYDGKTFTAPPEPAKTPEEQAAENLAIAQSEYDRATIVINELNEQIQDEDYDGTTEEAVKDELAAWTNYRKELRAYIKAADGSQQLPSAPSN